MAEYCTSAEVKKRATANGWRWIADRDGDGRLNTGESDSVTLSIQLAGDDIDDAIQKRIDVDDARGQQNARLKRLAVQLAMYYLWTNAGDDPPESVQAGFDRATAALTGIKGGADITGLTYNPPYSSQTPARVPRAYMPR